MEPKSNLTHFHAEIFYHLVAAEWVNSVIWKHCLASSVTTGVVSDFGRKSAVALRSGSVFVTKRLGLRSPTCRSQCPSANYGKILMSLSEHSSLAGFLSFCKTMYFFGQPKEFRPKPKELILRMTISAESRN